jgi:D-alanyl-D-alanine carboxypeptidase
VSSPLIPARLTGVVIAATLSTALTGAAGLPAPGPGGVPAAEPSPSPSAGPLPSGAAEPADADADADADAAIIGWEDDAHHLASDTFSDVVVVQGASGRHLEVQQWTGGTWVVRRTIPLAPTRTDLVDVTLSAHWKHAPATLWRLHVPARGPLPEVTSRIQRVTVTWRAATDPTDPTVLVNKSAAVEPAHWRPADLVTPDMTTQGDRVRLHPEAATALTELAAAAEDATGHPLVLVSGFRSADYQGDLFARYAREHGERRAARFSARAGHSEHQTGWAADVTQAGVPFTDFGGTPSSDWVAENAWRHGFVVRYTTAGSTVTGYDAEPWHLRYVGPDLAAYLDTTGRTLEEAFDATD